jgi:hypothetical protein
MAIEVLEDVCIKNKDSLIGQYLLLLIKNKDEWNSNNFQ